MTRITLFPVIPGTSGYDNSASPALWVFDGGQRGSDFRPEGSSRCLLPELSFISSQKR